MTEDWTRRAERLWRLIEPYHAVAYFAAEHRAACDDVGLKGGWMAYFASRAAPLGAVGPEVVTALFYGFHPAMVRRAIPDAWQYSTPGRVLAARLDGVDAAFQRLLGEGLADPTLDEAAGLAAAAVDAADPAGRPLFAANAALPVPEAPHLALWQAATALREHRGDGHVATLVTEGVGACDAHVLQVATGRTPRADIQPFRGFSDDDWAEAADRLASRGWVDADGTATPAGRQARDRIEGRTNLLAAAPFQALGPERADALLRALAQATAGLRAGGTIPYPNAIGVPEPDEADAAGGS